MQIQKWILGLVLVLGGLGLFVFKGEVIGRFIMRDSYDDPELINQKWLWQETLLSDGSIFEPVTIINEPYLEFTDERIGYIKVKGTSRDDRSFSGSIGCNHTNGNYMVARRGRINFTLNEQTLLGCGLGNNNETHWTERIMKIEEYEIEGSELRFVTNDGDVLIFTRE